MARVKAAHIGLRVNAPIKKAVERAAADDRRSVASYIEKLLTENLTTMGYLAVKQPRTGHVTQGAADARAMAHFAIDTALQHSTDSPSVQRNRRRVLTELPSGVGKSKRRK